MIDRMMSTDGDQEIHMIIKSINKENQKETSIQFQYGSSYVNVLNLKFQIPKP